MTRLIIASLVSLGLVLGGCQSAAHGPVVVQAGKSGPMKSKSAPYDAQYVLYGRAATTRPADEIADVQLRRVHARELTAQWLRKGERLGFRAGGPERLVAFAGSDELVVPRGNYHWHVRPGTAPHSGDMQEFADNLGKAATVVVGIGLIGLGIVAALRCSEHAE